MPHFIYITDPMCSWCYGFSPELQALIASTPDAQLDIIVGGLRPYTEELIPDQLRHFLHEHWQQVAQASKQPFVHDGLEHPGFKYDTEPSCRAVVAALHLAPNLNAAGKMAILSALQTAFYAEGKNVTQKDVLAAVTSAALRAQGVEVSEEQFAAFWESDQCKNETREHFMQTQRWKVSGFPTLVMEHQEQLALLTNGYAKLAQLQERIAAVTNG
ncbi:MAG: DsbA family protein [Burkholderiales bacterium]|nr:DsbA family protein [Burkholderiales bacterium]